MRDGPEKPVCVDLNGVLDTYRGWRGRPTWHPPREGAEAFLRALAERGHRVVVLTTRDPSEARAWLRRYGLERWVADVTDRKVPALAYVDDRAVPFTGDFAETLAALDGFRTFWEADGDEEGAREAAPGHRRDAGEGDARGSAPEGGEP